MAQIRFFAIAVAADGASGSSGDWVYAASHATDDVTPVPSAGWGAVKTLYRR